MYNKVTARPCKENGTWEIMDQNGYVRQKHYNSKEACVAAARELAQEAGCELTVENQTSNNSQSARSNSNSQSNSNSMTNSMSNSNSRSNSNSNQSNNKNY